MNFAATPIPFTVIGAFESRPVCDGAEPGLAKSGAAGLTALRRRWPLFDLRARKVSGQRSGLEAHGARPVRAAGWARWWRRGRVRAQRRGGGGALAFALVCVGQSSAFGGGKKLAREAARGLRTGRGGRYG